MADGERKFVKVGCAIPNGIALRIFKLGYDDGSGHRPMVQDGFDVILRGPSTADAGVNDRNLGGAIAESEVDEAWWRAWYAQNEKSPLVTGKQVYLIEPEKRPEDERPDDHD